MLHKCLSLTPGSHSACAVSTPLGVDQKILSIGKEPMLSGFLTLNAEYATEALSTTCAVYIENCEGWWLSDCHGSVASTGGSSQRCPGFHSWRLPAFSLFSPRNI